MCNMILMSEKMTSQNKLYEIKSVSYNKPHKEVEYVAVKKMKLVIMSYNSIYSMCCLGGIFCHRFLSAILRKKIGEPKEEI
jgi:hypothetical protein